MERGGGEGGTVLMWGCYLPLGDLSDTTLGSCSIVLSVSHWVTGALLVF